MLLAFCLIEVVLLNAILSALAIDRAYQHGMMSHFVLHMLAGDMVDQSSRLAQDSVSRLSKVQSVLLRFYAYHFDLMVAVISKT